MLTAGGTLVNDLGDAIARDPEVRQVRTIAEAARTRLVACMSRPEHGLDLAEAQQMLDALRNAQALAGDAEDRVLVHHGLLTPAEVGKRAAQRRPCATKSEAPARPVAARRSARRPNVARLIAGTLALLVLGAVGAALAQRFGVRLPLARQ